MCNNLIKNSPLNSIYLKTMILQSILNIFVRISDPGAEVHLTQENWHAHVLMVNEFLNTSDQHHLFLFWYHDLTI